jgi:RNA polymerase sigma factor (sigma-70 family)
MQTLTESVNQKKGHWTNEHLNMVLNGCRKNERAPQKELYCNYYGFAMSITLQYLSSYDSAVDRANDSFLKVFKALKNFNPAYDRSSIIFIAWFRKILTNTCIDHIRSNRKELIADVEIEDVNISQQGETAEDWLQHKDVVKCIQQLSPAYKAAINLYVIEGYSHAEIAERFHITEGASKSNLFKAKRRLKVLLKSCNAINHEKICSTAMM